MTQDGFARMIDDSNAFFAELRQNNNKEWFNPRKDHYNDNIRKPAEFFAELLADDLSRIADRTMKPKVFRIYRDIRFSKDKTPLKPYLHILWSPAEEAPLAPVYFFGSEPGDMTVGFGLPSLKGGALTRFRSFVDSGGEALEKAIMATGMSFATWSAEPLKRVPKPYDADHPQAELLKRKNLILHSKMDDGWRSNEGGLVSAVRAEFKRAEPLRKLLSDRLAST